MNLRRLGWIGAAVFAAAMALASSATAQTGVVCSGHDLLPAPRPEASCLTVQPQIFASPDGMVRALVYPADVDLYATPDMESRVVLRSAAGKLLTSKDFSSPRGSNGYYVVSGRWSPDSQFFVFSLSSSGGHSPWSFPIWVFSRQSNAVVSFSAMIGDNPTIAGDFRFAAPHTLTATTWTKPGETDKGVPVSVDLAEAIKKLPPSAD